MAFSSRAWSFIVVLLALAFSPAPASAADSVVALPPLMVEEKGVTLRWRYLAVPGGEFLSVCDDDVAERFVRRQFRLEELLGVILPERFQAKLAVPEVQILFNEETGRARSREIVAEMVARSGAKVRPDGTIELPPRAIGFRGRTPPEVRFLPNLRLADSDSSRVFAIVRDQGPMEFTFTKDRIAFLLGRRAPALPDWFVDGLLELYPHLGFSDGEIEFRALPWPTAPEPAPPDGGSAPRRLLPLEEIFGRWRPAGADSLTEPDRLWRAQAMLFLHWALTDRTGARREALWRWLDRLEVEPLSEESFEACFGLGFCDARERLREHLPNAMSEAVTLRGPRRGRWPSTKFRPATDLEIARIRGDWERLQIAFVRQRYPEMVEAYVGQARRTLRRAYDRGERDPQLMALMGLTENEAGNPALARGFLEAAVREKVVRPRAHFELARMRFKELLEIAKERRFEPGEVQSVLQPLLATRKTDPPLLEIYGLISSVWTRSATPPAAADLAVLDEGVRLFPGSPALLLQAIQLQVAHGTVARAATIAEIGARHSREAAHRERFLRLHAEIRGAKQATAP